MKKKYVVLGALTASSLVVAIDQAEASEQDVMEDTLVEEPEVAFEEEIAVITSAEVSEEAEHFLQVEVTEEAPIQASAIEAIDLELEAEVEPADADVPLTVATQVEAPIVLEVAAEPATVDTTIESVLVAATNPTIAEQFPDEELQQVIIRELGNVLTPSSVLTDELIESVYSLSIVGDWENPTIKSLQGISIFKNLKTLGLRDLAIEELPSEIGQLKNLENFSLNSTLSLVKQPPVELWSLPLRDLHIQSAPITDFPEIPAGSKVLSTLGTIYLVNLDIQNIDFMLYKPFEKLQHVLLRTLKLAHLPDTETFPILSNGDGLSVELAWNQSSWIPKLYKDYAPFAGKNIIVNIYGGMLSDEVIEEMQGAPDEYFRQQLTLKNDNQVLQIHDDAFSDYETLYNLVMLKGERMEWKVPPFGYEVSRAHDLQLTDLVDENGNPAQLSDFYVDGVVIKSGTLKARIYSKPGENALGGISPYHMTDYMTIEFVAEAKPVKVLYVDENGNEIQASSTYTGELGEAYKIEAPTIEGYTYVSSEGEIEGEYTTFPATVTFIYKVESTEVEPPEEGVEDDDGPNHLNTDKPNNPNNPNNPNTASIIALPQTNGVATTGWSMLGFAMLLFSSLLFWRRKDLD